MAVTKAKIQPDILLMDELQFTFDGITNTNNSLSYVQENLNLVTRYIFNSVFG
jgi:hypothetical protein